MTRMQAIAVVAFLRRQYGGSMTPVVTHEVANAAQTYAEVCVACHRMSGEGGTVGPDLTYVGRRRDEDTLRKLIEDPLTAYPDSEMPPFKDTLSADQISALARYLASRK
jgi:mono/diheme cytochrome c family protein